MRLRRRDIGWTALVSVVAFAGLASCGRSEDESPTSRVFVGRAALSSRAPLLYLDSATLSALRARAQANDPAWINLRTKCDAMAVPEADFERINGTPYPAGQGSVGPGHIGSGYVEGVATIGLCYRVVETIDATRAASYAQAGDRLLATMACDPGPPEPWTCGSGVPCCLDKRDTDYGVRHYPVAAALGYDWLYPAMSTNTAAAVRKFYEAWMNYYGTSGYLRNQPNNNYYAPYFLAKTTGAIAMFDDSASAQTYWNEVDTVMWPTQLQPWVANSLNGGGWPEGHTYGASAVPSMFMALWAAKTGKQRDWLSQISGAGPWAQSKYLRYFSWPSLRHFDDQGYIRDNGVPPDVTPSLTITTAMATLMERLGDTTSSASMARGFAQDVLTYSGAVKDDRELWHKFLFWDPGLSQSSYTNEPLSYVVKGAGPNGNPQPSQLAFRSDWTRTAKWGALVGGKYIGDVTGQLEQSYNEGSFVAVSGDDPIVVNPFGYVVQENGDFGAMMDFDRDFDSSKPGSGERKIANIFVIPRTANQRKGQWQFTNTNTHIERYEDTGTFVRGRAANLGEMYEPTTSSGPSRVSLWTRDMVYVRPGLFVLYDRTTVADTTTDRYFSFWVPSPPVSGSVNDATQRRYDIQKSGATVGSLRTILPASASVTISNIDAQNPSPSQIRGILIREPAKSLQRDWLTTVTAGSAVPDQVAISSGSLTGVHFKSSPREAVVLFNNVHDGTGTTSSGGYVVTQLATADHVLTDMAASANGYSVTATPSGGSLTIAVSQNGPCGLSPGGNLAFAVTTAGAVTCANNISPCTNASAGAWQSVAFPGGPQTGTFSAQFTVTPGGTGIDAGVGLSNGAQTAWTSLAAIVRFDGTTMRIDARNGGTYSYSSPSPISFTAGSPYGVRMVVNVASHTYSAWVTRPGESEQLLARNFNFRTEQNQVSQLTHWVAADDGGTLQVCNPAYPAIACSTATQTTNFPSTLFGSTKSTNFTAEWDVTPSVGNVDGAIGLAGVAVSGWSNLSSIVLFNSQGLIQARNYDLYGADNVVNYSAGATYHVRLAVQFGVPNTYSAWITTPGGVETQVASGYRFRDSAQTNSLDRWTVAKDPATAGSVTACDFSLH